MSWFSDIVNNIFGWGGEDPLAVQQRQAAQAAQAAAAAKAAEDKRIAEEQAAASAAQNVAPTTAPAAAPAVVEPEKPPPYSGPSAWAKLEALLPPGFEQTALPESYASPFIESSMAAGRGTAEDFISNMLRRGTLTGSGEKAARAALSAQDPTVRSRLASLSNALLEGERAKLRGIAGEGYTAAQAPGETGEFFDPAPYQARTQAELAQFQQAFPGSYTASVGDTGALYDLASLGAAGGAVTSPQNVQFDPLAAEGGRLATGLEEPAPPPKKKRTTAVF